MHLFPITSPQASQAPHASDAPVFLILYPINNPSPWSVRFVLLSSHWAAFPISPLSAENLQGLSVLACCVSAGWTWFGNWTTDPGDHLYWHNINLLSFLFPQTMIYRNIHQAFIVIQNKISETQKSNYPFSEVPR